MNKSIILLVVLGLYYSQVASHTVLSSIRVDGTQYKEFEGMRPHPSSNYDYPISQKGRQNGLQTDDMICGWLPAANQPANRKIAVKPGSTVGIQWHYEAGQGASDTYIIAPDHKGPCIYYMAKMDSTGLPASGKAVWFKVYEDGYNPSTKQFCVDKLRENKGYMEFQLPTDITPGNYLLRGEVIALHEGFELYGAQPYVGCFEVTMSGSGTVNPGNLVGFPGAYKATDAGINFNVYQSFKSYPIPGPAVYVSGSSSTPSTPTPSTPTPSTPTPSTPTPSTPTPSPTTPTNGKQCYLPDTPFVEGKLGKGGRCGSKFKTRCADGQCCSKFGYCGNTAEYCSNNIGDYRKYPCSQAGTYAIPTNQYYANQGEEELEYETSSSSRVYAFGFATVALIALMI